MCTLYNAPRVRTEDLFQVWAYPHTASDPSEVTKVFVRTKVTFNHLMEKRKNGTAFFNPREMQEQGKNKDEIADCV